MREVISGPRKAKKPPLLSNGMERRVSRGDERNDDLAYYSCLLINSLHLLMVDRM